ncbi:ZPR1 zinc-finger domain-containing protein [Xylariomycetidae sp. FL0641]|nr:ZPR1 zinc-finger domain-containing protein [Xylariomycetidae sp. FL0641]
MSVPEKNVTNTVSPTDFFESIGQKAGQLAPDATATNGAPNGDSNDEKVVEEIESLCMNCRENGVTRMLLTAIPYFREVILMSFSCEKCGFSNSEIQSAGTIQPKGSSYLLRLTAMEDFERQVIKSDTAIVKFIELDLEVPAGRGQLTNVEGLLSSIVEDLELGQEARKEQMPEVHAKVAEIITKGRAMLAGEAFPFRLSVDDPAGNSWISPNMRDGIGKWERRDYLRTPEQNEALGLAATDPAAGGVTGEEEDIVPEQVYEFPASCPGCMHNCVTRMKMVDIPHFKAVVLMSTVCASCGYKSNDVKTGGEIPELGKRITLKVETPEDLARDILKSETCALESPELNLQVNPGTLGGRFTTVEGLLTQIRDDLHSQIFDFSFGAGGGDSQVTDDAAKWTTFFEGLDAAIKGNRKFTIILADPLASSYVQKAVDPDQDDPQMTIEEYTRTHEEEEDLGLLDMKVEGYEKDAEKEAEAKKEADA